MCVLICCVEINETDEGLTSIQKRQSECTLAALLGTLKASLIGWSSSGGTPTVPQLP